MSDSAKFSALNSKIGTLHSKLLKDDQYIEIAKFEEVDKIKEYLNKNSFINLNLTQDDTTVDIEIKLYKYKKEQIKKENGFLEDPYKKFGQVIMSKFEIIKIKKILHDLHKGNNDSKNEVLQFKNGLKVEIKNDMTIKQFIDKLKNTAYYAVLQSYKNEGPDTILFYMEMNLDKLYYTNLIKSTDRFSYENKNCVKQMIGQLIDLLNIIWIYRGIKFYDLLREEIINFCILGGCDFNYNALKYFSYLDSIDDLKNEILKTRYKFLFDSTDIDLYLKRRADRYIYYIAKNNYSKDVFNIGKYISYLILIEAEIKDIIALIEATRFKFSYQNKIKYLIRNYNIKNLH